MYPSDGVWTGNDDLTHNEAKAASQPPHSKTLRACAACRSRGSVLECGGKTPEGWRHRFRRHARTHEPPTTSESGVTAAALQDAARLRGLPESRQRFGVRWQNPGGVTTPLWTSRQNSRTSNDLRKRRHSRRTPRRSAPARSAGVAAAFWSAVAKPRRGGDTAFDFTRLLTLTPRGQLQLELLHGSLDERVILEIFADAGGTCSLHGCSLLGGRFWCRHRFRLGCRCGGWFGRG